MRYALLSVSDKTGLKEFAQTLIECGFELLASGGTSQFLRDNKFAVTEVAQYTGAQEILGGRVKTLHPAIHGGILSRRDASDRKELAVLGYNEIDLVVVNLYPFAETIAKKNTSEADAIENIDIGGVALIRAAAKNYKHVTLVCDPRDYENVAHELKKNSVPSIEFSRTLAYKGFALCTRYDAAISNWLDPEGDNLLIAAEAGQKLRYGENPHQSAQLFTTLKNAGPLGGRFLQGKSLSYNNILDLDAAWRAVCMFTNPACVIVKHLSPCGIATAPQISVAVANALAADPVSAFGGVLASNVEVDAEAIRSLGELFYECIIAPSFSVDALDLIAKKKNVRLIEMGPHEQHTQSPEYEVRSIRGGFLRQRYDAGDPLNTEWKLVSQRAATVIEMSTLQFAWNAVIAVKSNAIVLAQPVRDAEGNILPHSYATVGIGAGQANRIDATKIAIGRANTEFFANATDPLNGQKAQGAVLASDAFFPFNDCLEFAGEAGITAVCHPGGSIRDADTVTSADKYNIALYTSGVRHFRH